MAHLLPLGKPSQEVIYSYTVSILLVSSTYATTRLPYPPPPAANLAWHYLLQTNTEDQPEHRYSNCPLTICPTWEHSTYPGQHIQTTKRLAQVTGKQTVQPSGQTHGIQAPKLPSFMPPHASPTSPAKPNTTRAHTHTHKDIAMGYNSNCFHTCCRHHETKILAQTNPLTVNRNHRTNPNSSTF